MPFTDIHYEVQERVATIRLNRPSALNALVPEMLTEIEEAFDSAAADESVRAIVLTGEGRGFSAGADLMAMLPSKAQGLPDLGDVLDTYYNPLILKMRALPKPVIAAVNGPAAGAGASLALMADLTIAARSAYFLEAFVNVGLIPDSGGTWALVRSLGPQRAMGLSLLGERLSAEQAKAWGLIWDVVADEQLRPYARSIAVRLAAGPGLAIERIKRLVQAAAQNELAAHLTLECRLQRECGRSQDFAEGAAAFAQKRKPDFRNC